MAQPRTASTRLEVRGAGVGHSGGHPSAGAVCSASREPETSSACSGSAAAGTRTAASQADGTERTAKRGVPELSAHQLRLFETVTGSPTNGVTRVRATALSTHERIDAGGADEPKCTELGTPEGA